MADRVLARIQWWLQGHPKRPGSPVRDRPWWVAWAGNKISDYRYWRWRRNRG